MCAQWLRRYGRERLGLTIRNMGRYWSRDGSVEMICIAELDERGVSFRRMQMARGQCCPPGRFQQSSGQGVQPFRGEMTKTGSIYPLCRRQGCAPELKQIAAEPDERLFLVGR